ncbi:PAS domain S-box protein [bacterium]|nr:MAG: PAS domain S-box protein [bacterium]
MQNPEATKRQREILLLAADGRTDKEIAKLLGVGRGTVVTHWKRMRERTGAINRAQAIAFEMGHVYREAERERARTAGLYQGLIECLEDFAVFLLDENRTITTWNPGVGIILGYAEEEWIGQPGDIIFLPEERAAGVPDGEQETATREGRALDDRWHVRKDGSRFWASGVMVAVRNEEGELLCYSKILRNLTQLKRLEERVKALGGDPDEAS